MDCRSILFKETDQKLLLSRENLEFVKVFFQSNFIFVNNMFIRSLSCQSCFGTWDVLLINCSRLSNFFFENIVQIPLILGDLETMDHEGSLVNNALT